MLSRDNSLVARMVTSLGASMLLSLLLGVMLAWTMVDFLPWWSRYAFWQTAGIVIPLSILTGYLGSVVDPNEGSESAAGGRLRAKLGVITLVVVVGGWFWYVLRPTIFGGASPLPGLGGHPLAYLGIIIVVGLIQIVLGYCLILSGLDTYTASKQSCPELDATVTRLAQSADVAKPRIKIVESAVPNSMAMRLGNSSSLVVSTGLLDALSDDERDAVLAHELAHLKNRDATVMTLAQSVSAFAGRLFAAGGTFNRRAVNGSTASKASKRASHRSKREWKRTNDNFGDPTSVIGVISAGVSGFIRILTLLLAWPFWVVGLLAYAVLSRHRELAADRAAIAITGDPDALASALETLSGDGPPGVDLRLSEAAPKPACIVPQGFSESESGSASVAFRTHPTLDERLENLKRLSTELQSQ